MALLAAASALVLLGSASCVDPQSDYTDYVGRAADAQGPPSSTGTVEAGPVDSSNWHAPDGSFADNRYLMACEVELGPSAANAFLWVATLTFTAKAGGGGTVSLTDQPLLAMATNINSLAPGGAAATAGPASIAKDGTGTLMTATQNLPGGANPISGAAAEIDNSFLAFQVEADDTVCAHLGGNLSKPVTQPLHPTQNTCIFRKANPDGTFTALQDSDFHCP